jgi:exopolysaccharide biosynthesis polyprenyl glycosylphosphotransferase
MFLAWEAMDIAAGIGAPSGAEPRAGTAGAVASPPQSTLAEHLVVYEGVLDSVDPRTLEILRRRRVRGWSRRRGWLVRRLLLASDLVGLALAFTFARPFPNLPVGVQVLVLLASLPVWVVAAKIFGLYDGDDVRTDHSTVDDLVGVFELITTGAWAFVAVPSLLGLPGPSARGALIFWLAGIALLVVGRAGVRTAVRQRLIYLQNTIIVGAGDVGQLVARKFLHHAEYGINLIGFVDDAPLDRRAGLEHLSVLGPLERLPQLVRQLDVERVVIAFSLDHHERILAIVRRLRSLSVQIDIVPRAFELIGPSVRVHTVEGLPLLGLPPVRLARSSRLVKRGLDVAVAICGLLLCAPFFAVIALLIRRDSPGPIFFRQVRLGINQRPFAMLKFRSMRDGTSDAEHRNYIEATSRPDADLPTDILYKLDRGDSVTRVGRWLRRTSLDELPQLLNVLRGDMSLVGPRPCLPYEVEHFDTHHFDRFLVPAGITGLWQVTARAHATFIEALDMDVAYARGWSLGLDVALALRTLRQLVGGKATT